MKFSEGLEALGTAECLDNGEMYYGVFQESSVENIELPSTLKRIESRAFSGCYNLKNVKLPPGLKYIGPQCFSHCGLKEFSAPPGMKEIDRTFSDCESLRQVVLNEGLEVLKDPFNNTEI